MAGALDVVKDAASSFLRDRATHHAAALAYYSLFALGPMVLIATAVAGIVFRGAKQQVIDQLGTLIGPDAAAAVGRLMGSGAGSTGAIVAGAATLLIGAGAVYRHLQLSMNAIWGVRRLPPSGWAGRFRMVARRYGIGIAGTLGIGFLLLVSLLLAAVIAAAAAYGESVLPGSVAVWRIAQATAMILVTTLLFALIFHHVPDAEVAWRDSWVGAGLTAALFVAGQALIGAYIGNAELTTRYGAVGAVLTLLVWLYYSGLVFFFGAELTQAYAGRYGKKVEPSSGARRFPSRPEPDMHD